MQKLVTIRRKHRKENIRQIFSVFLYEDWNTLLCSMLILALDLVAHFIMHNYTPWVHDMKVGIPLIGEVPFIILTFLFALILGYGGQRIIYKYLGTAEEFITKKAGELENLENNKE